MVGHLFRMNKFNSQKYNRKTFKHLEDYADNFQKINSVRTELLYGKIDRNKKIFLSVIIPTFNRKRLLLEALKSVLSQFQVSFEWEILIVDNTPLDRNNLTPALEIVKKINNTKVLYYHNNVNIGSGYNWNRGVELARGEWVTFLHDDDLLCHDALKNIENIIKAYSNLNKKLGYIHANMQKFSGIFDEKKIVLKKMPFLIELTQFTTLLLGHTYTGMPSCGTTILKQAYVDAGGINYDFGSTADAILGYQIMKKYTVLRSNAVLGGYRWEDNETLHMSTINNLLITDALFAKYRLEKEHVLQFICRLYLYMYKKTNKREKYRISKNKLILSWMDNIFVVIFITFRQVIKMLMVIKGLIYYRI